MTKLADLWKIDPEYGYPDLNQATVGDLVEVLTDPETQEQLGAEVLHWYESEDPDPDADLRGTLWRGDLGFTRAVVVVPLSRLEDTHD